MLPFSEYKVVEIGSRIGSGFCGKLLCGFGAEVILVEDTVDNYLRHLGPFPDAVDPEKSGLFGYLHAGKKSLHVNRRNVPELDELVCSADVLIFGTGNVYSQKETDLFDRLSKSHDRLISIHISPYGMTGPYSKYAGTELTSNALSGITQRMGKPGRPPLTMPLAQAGFQAGYAGASGAACALIQRDTANHGDIVEVSEAEAMATVHAGYAVTRFQRAGILDKRAGHRLSNLPYPQTVLPCSDGYVELNTPEGSQWKRLLQMMGSPEWSKEERYRSRMKNSRSPMAEELDIKFKEWLKDYTKEDFYKLCREFEVPSGPVRTVDEIVKDDQLLSRDFFTSIRFHDGERYLVPGSGCSLSKTPAKRDLLVPRKGSASEQINSAERNLPKFGSLAKEGASVRSSAGPLQGLRVLDMGWVWAGAIPGQILADMGAEVIKVESKKRIDYMRLGRPLIGTDPDVEQNPWFHAVNRNKKSIAVNLKSTAGLEILKKLVGKCDAVIENFKPGFLAKIGMDYNSLSKINPSLVMLSMSGVGQTGPLSDIPAYAPFLSGLSGLDSLVGYPGEDILGIQQPYADTNAGVTGAFGLITALLHRKRSGEGQHVDLAETEAAISVLGEAFLHYSMTNTVMEPQGNFRYGYVPCGHYPTKGEDAWIAIAVESEQQWASLCRVLGKPDLAVSSSFQNKEIRNQNRGILDQALSELTSLRETDKLFHALQAEGISAMPLLGPDEVMRDPHFVQRGTFIDIDHPVLGKEVIFGPMWRQTTSSMENWAHAPLLGQHTFDVMTDLLAMTKTEVEELILAEALI